MADEPSREIVGIVGNVRELGIYRNASPAVYFPQPQLSDGANAAIIRNAPSLGSERGAIRRMVIRRGLFPVLVGGAARLAAAYSFANVLASTLYGVAPHDPAVFVAVPMLLAAVLGVAACAPAVRASRVDPAVTLRRA